MATKEAEMHDHNGFDTYNWPVALLSFVILPWLNDLWNWVPTPTAIYTLITSLFMLFQMADKLGWLERFKKRPKIEPKLD